MSTPIPDDFLDQLEAEADAEAEKRAKAIGRASASVTPAGMPRSFVLRFPGANNDPVSRCRAYLLKVPGGIQGANGSKGTFKAARIIWNDFGLDETDGWELLCEWNQTCHPVWPLEEENGNKQNLRRKWDQAIKRGPCPKGRGWRLKEGAEAKWPDQNSPRDRIGTDHPADAHGVSPPSVTGHSTSTEQAPPTRPRIIHNARQFRDVVNDAANALAEANNSPHLFERGGNMVRIRDDEIHGLVIEGLSEPGVQLELSNAADWFAVRKTPRGEQMIEDDAPSMEAVRGVLARPDWPGIPHLAGIRTSPLFTADGELLIAPGYDRRSKYVYRPHPTLTDLRVPEVPTDDDIAAATRLLNEPIEEFPFADQASRAHALGFMIEPFVRELIDGPTPLRLFEAPTEGTGKTLLLQTVVVPAFGELVDPLQEVGSLEEWRKTIFSALLESPGLVWIDNINQKLDSGPFAAALTARRLRQRILGVSRMQSVLIKNLWAATGNNVRMSREMVRRVIASRQLPNSETPYEGRTFKRKLPYWAVQHRAQLVTACLTLGRAWLVRGRPAGSKTLGMYESWAETMGGILDVAGIPGFLENMSDYRKGAVDAEGEWTTLVKLWWERHQGNEVKLVDLYDLAAGEDILETVPDPVKADGSRERNRNRGAKTKFGAALSKASGRVYAGCRIRSVGNDSHSKMAKYKLELLPNASPPPPAVPHSGPGYTVADNGDTLELDG